MMTKADSPWSGLVAGGIDARRVSPSGNQDFFWVLSASSEPGLVLRLEPETAEILPIPKLRNLDIAYRDIGGRRALVLLLKDDEQRELFCSLCRDIVLAGELAKGNSDALHRTLRRTMRWHHLLRGGQSGALSLEEQRGLIGELNFLEHLIDLIGPRAAIETWRGPFGSSKDFELDGCLVEVKARRGAARPYVQISSADQLADIIGFRLFLSIYAVDAVVKPSGQTLTEIVAAMDRLFSMTDSEAFSLWEDAIAATGFDFSDDYSERRWGLGNRQLFEVVDGFPRIGVPVPNGVSSVRYSISLDVCEPYSVEEAVVDSLIVKRSGPWTS